MRSVPGAWCNHHVMFHHTARLTKCSKRNVLGVTFNARRLVTTLSTTDEWTESKQLTIDQNALGTLSGTVNIAPCSVFMFRCCDNLQISSGQGGS